MSLQVCEYPKCKKITLLSLCEEHADELTEDEAVDIEDEEMDAPKPVQTKETAMNGAMCSKSGCAEKSADDSKQCVKHRDQQRAANAKYQGRTVETEKPTRSYTRRALAPSFPPSQSRTAITLADPKIINPAPNGNGSSAAIAAIDELIIKLGQDQATLIRAKEMLEQ